MPIRREIKEKRCQFQEMSRSTDVESIRREVKEKRCRLEEKSREEMSIRRKNLRGAMSMRRETQEM